ncbi:hypothetical protein DEU56DRAFT_915289 [Suillus clintonianus]|uniref:uncharacterized protein n=1 Tax=Suillus clintonianus TaxID=1904413 RepID=UPI001B86AFA9|nr:uncharacterized protein DEU56DRAFT_915289 [Suillus clintonianus]KAG2128967.1 hypothetical protein DEU56DRAFT_915289 [Suillus clintonianus]
MLPNHEVGRLLRVFLKALARHAAFSLRLIRHLFHTLLRLYSRITSRRQFLPIQRDGRLERVAASSQPVLPVSHNQLQMPQPGSATNSYISLLPVHTPPTSANHPTAPVLPQPCPLEFRPFLPSQVMRYNKGPTIKHEVKVLNIPAVKRDYEDSQNSGDWYARVHPEGALYFHDTVRGIYTDSSMGKKNLRSTMDTCLNELLVRMPCGLHLSSGGIELVMELTRSKNNVRICRYYFVDHYKRLLFWLDEISTERIFDGIQGVEKWSHIKYAIEHQYWQVCHCVYSLSGCGILLTTQHCELYPSAKLPHTLKLKELKELVVHASAEIITTDLSLSPFDGDELSNILSLIDRVEGAHSICVIVRFMRYFTRAQFFNFYGLSEARLNADQSVFVKEKSSSLIAALSWALNAAMFDAPRSHMEELRRVWVDRSINTPRWKNFNSKLSSEWSGITMYSTVMLAVDVSFLAVPSVNLQNAGSVTVISTYISLFCVVGSLVVSFFLTRQNRVYGQESADTAVDFLMQMTGSAFGTKALATVHGLPYAMLLWGMVYFMLALSYQVFTSTPIVTLATTGSACGIVALFTLWLVSAARDFHLLTWLLARLKAWKEKS